jgi:hypothetical protein
MKVLATVVTAGLALAMSASAATFTVTATCTATGFPGGFSYSSNPTTNSGTFTCNGLSGIGSVVGFSSFTGATLFLTNDFTGGASNAGTNTSATLYQTFTGGFSGSPDTLTASGFPPPGNSSLYTDTLGNPQSPVFGVYFVDPLSGSLVSGNAPSFGFSYTNAANGATVGGVTTVGTVSGTSGNAFVQYTYTTSSSVPEPVSFLMIGSGMFTLALVGRKKLIRK